MPVHGQHQAGTTVVIDETGMLTTDDPRHTVKALFRGGDPAGVGKPAMTAGIRAGGGWFGGVDEFPDLPMDPDVESVSRPVESA